MKASTFGRLLLDCLGFRILLPVATLSPVEQRLIREFMQALEDEIVAIKRGRGGAIVTVHVGRFVRREGPFFDYVFSTENPLIVMDDAPAEVEIGGQKFSGQIVSVQGREVAVGIESDCGKLIAEELIDIHKLGSDIEIAPGTRRPIQADRKCQKCSATMVLVRGPHSVFVGCMDYPKCDNRYPIRRGDKITTEVICVGKDGVPCDKPMIVVVGRNGVYLKCSDVMCKATRNIP